MEPFWANDWASLYHADAREIPLPDKSVHMVVTSPPYWNLRDYGLSQWQGGDAECGHKRPDAVGNVQRERTPTFHFSPNTNQGSNMAGWPNGICGHCGATQQAAGIGLEPTLGEWVENIVTVAREVWRVLRDDGVFFLNLGDAYTGSGKGHTANGNRKDGDKQNTNRGSIGLAPDRKPRISPGLPPEHWNEHGAGLPSKNLMGQPWRAAFALQDDGWYLRSDIIWHKKNPMPGSQHDRPTTSHEYIFLFSKKARYFYDGEDIREPVTGGAHAKRKDGSNVLKHGRDANDNRNSWQDSYQATSATSRDVWTFATQGYPGAHFATFPPKLPRLCILAGTSAYGVCADCAAPWTRVTEKQDPNGRLGKGYHDHTNDLGRGQRGVFSAEGAPVTQTIGWRPTCTCNAAVVPATVLDPFAGSGTTLAVAQELGRLSIGLDLSPEFLEMARDRISAKPGITQKMNL